MYPSLRASTDGLFVQVLLFWWTFVPWEDLLDIRRGIVALTKKDMVDDEWLTLVTEDIKELM